MPSDFWQDDEREWEWDDVESIHLLRDDEGWHLYAEIDGELTPINEDEPLPDDVMQEEFWDDLYYDLLDLDIDIDREISYSSDET